MKKLLFYPIYWTASRVWILLDKLASWRETRWWIDLLPSAMFSRRAYVSYAGWLHNQGLLSGIIASHLKVKHPHIFDWGCGYGGMAPVAYHFVKHGGSYVGVDTDRRAIKACGDTYAGLTNCRFYQTEDSNPYYPQLEHSLDVGDWPMIGKSSQDLVLAMSVFTHLQENMAVAYMDKLCSVIKPGGLLIATFLVVGDGYRNSNKTFHFDWQLTPGWRTANPQCPEMSIGVSMEALKKFTCRFETLLHIPGTMTGGDGPCLQDTLVLKLL